MRTTKSKIVAVLSAAVLVMGTFFIVRAVEKEKPAVKVEKTIALVPEPWYFNPTEPTNNPNLAQNYSRTLPEGVTCGAPSGTICSIMDIPDATGNFPKMSHGNVTADSSDNYEKSYREE